MLVFRITSSIPINGSCLSNCVAFIHNVLLQKLNRSLLVSRFCDLSYYNRFVQKKTVFWCLCSLTIIRFSGGCFSFFTETPKNRFFVQTDYSSLSHKTVKLKDFDLIFAIQSYESKQHNLRDRIH